MDMITGWRTIVPLSVALSTMALGSVIALTTLPVYLRWFGRHPLFGLIAALPLTLMFGLVGRDLGMENLFWYGEPPVQVATGISIAALYVLLAFLTLVADEDADDLSTRCSGAWSAPARLIARVRRLEAAPRPASSGLPTVIAVVGLPLVALLLVKPVASAIVLIKDPVLQGRIQPPDWSVPGSAALTFLATALAARFFGVRRCSWHGWAAVLVPTAIINVLAAFNSTENMVTAAMVICLLCAVVALAIFATRGRNLLRFAVVVGLIVVMRWTNDDPFKLTYPGMMPYYEPNGAVKLITSSSGWHIDDAAGEKLLSDRAVRRVLSLWAGRKDNREKFVASPSIDDSNGYNARQTMELLGTSPQTLRSASNKADEVLKDFPHHRLALNLRCYCGIMWLEFKRLGFILPNEIHPVDERRIALKAADDAVAGKDQNPTTLFQRGQLLNPYYVPDVPLTGNDGKEIPRAKRVREASFSYEQAQLADPLFVRAGSRLAHMFKSENGDIDRVNRLYADAATAMIRLARAELADGSRRANGVPNAVPQNVAVDGEPGPAMYRHAIGAFNNGDLKSARIGFVDAMQAQPGPFAYAGVIESASGLLNDYEVLNRWRLSRSDTVLQGKPAPRPKLVVVAVSGGGIVAAAWTSRCLTEFEKWFSEFPYHVRIVTGASGGMVGAGHYVASLQRPIAGVMTCSEAELNRLRVEMVGAGHYIAFIAAAMARSEVELNRLRAEIDADSLTPVVRQMILRDLPSIFCPWRQDEDRGRVLEKTWYANSSRRKTVSGLSAKLTDLRAGEMEGWRPSLIISPLLVEDGAQMAISNLDLSHLEGISLHFFSTFPATRDTLQLGTALRMNAAFPFVTPAVSLPTSPARRVADAGYVDNYGIRLAAEWIRQNRDWLNENTSGVALVQIRAYKMDLPGHNPKGSQNEPPAPVATSLQWLTSPLEGYDMAKKVAMISLNQNLIKALEDSFDWDVDPSQDPDDSGKFRSFTFECSEEVPLSWMITRPDQKRLDDSLKSEGFTAERRRLIEFLTGVPDPMASSLTHVPVPSDLPHAGAVPAPSPESAATIQDVPPVPAPPLSLPSPYRPR